LTSRNSKLKYEIYSGAGNDFIMFDNRDNKIPFEKQKAFTKRICREKFIDIDGVIFLEKPKDTGNLMRMNYYNRDGSYGAMCGNGARCISQFAEDKKITKDKVFTFEAVDKIYKAEMLGGNIVKIDFPPPKDFKLKLKTILETVNKKTELNTNWMSVGSEHIVVFIDDAENKKVLKINSLDEARINEWGRLLREHKDFRPKGANVNFVQKTRENELRVRTYERGVERETLACGTGIISSAVVSALLKKTIPPVKILSQSGDRLTVDFLLEKNKITNLSLQGPAKKIGHGELEIIFLN
jgi:diaminopimelate epimerase